MPQAKYFAVAILTVVLLPELALGRGMNGRAFSKHGDRSSISAPVNFRSSRAPFHSQLPPSSLGSHPLPGRVATSPRSIFASHSQTPRSIRRIEADRHHHRQRRLIFVYNIVAPLWPYFASGPYCNYNDDYSAGACPYYPAPPAYSPAPVYSGEDAYVTAGPAPPAGNAGDAAPSDASEGSAADSGQFDRRGEEAFTARDYQGATRAWQHAAVDDPNNGALLMKLALAFFATGQYNEAAGAAQQGLALLPQAEWGQTVSRYAPLYANPQDYLNQLKSLQKAISEKPDEPALRFLLGFYSGYSGHPADAVRQLDKLVALAPKDQVGRKLRDLMAERIKQDSDSRFSEAQGHIYVRRDSHGVLLFSNVPTDSGYRPVVTARNTDYPAATSADPAQALQGPTKLDNQREY